LCGRHHEATIAQARRADHYVRGNRQSSDVNTSRNGKALQMLAFADRPEALRWIRAKGLHRCPRILMAVS
jgi:hypothetical protein